VRFNRHNDRLETGYLPVNQLIRACTHKLGTEYIYGPRKIDTKEGRALEAFFVSRQRHEASHVPVTKTKQPRVEMIE
jgi:hypothetical protein